MRHRPGASLLASLLLRVPHSGALALVALLAPFAMPAQTVREQVSVEVITVTVAARDAAGRPVRDLRAADLALSVDGKPVAIDTFLAETRAAAAASDAAAPVPMPAPAEPAALLPAPLPPPRPLEIAIIADESTTKSFDRRDVYDELSKFLSAPASGTRRFLVARFTVNGLVIECPWTPDTQAARAAIARLRAKPASERVPTAAELGSGDGPPTHPVEIEYMQKQFYAALLQAFAAFPETSARRELILVSGGTLLARPEDLAGPMSRSQRPTDRIGRSSRESRELFRSQEAERERGAFQLWSRAISKVPSEALHTSDLVAKALERDIVLVPIAAEAFDRGTNPGVDRKWPSRSAPGDVLGPNQGGVSLHTGVAEVMMGIAKDTGGEPVLVPRKTASRLAEIEDRSSFTLTFLDPAAGDHRHHRIEIQCRRPGVRIDYRRGYRIATEEERTLDRVVARFLQPQRDGNPLAVAATLAPVVSRNGRDVTRVSLRFSPPPESAMTGDRGVELVAVGEDKKGNRTEPIRWAGTASRLDGGTFEATLDLGVPAGSFTWSLGVRDQPTGLVSFVLAPSAR
jgi:VWFA-related protein